MGCVIVFVCHGGNPYLMSMVATYLFCRTAKKKDGEGDALGDVKKQQILFLSDVLIYATGATTRIHGSD